MVRDWRLESLADSIRVGQALAEEDAPTRQIEPFRAWVAETARRIRLFPVALRYANSWSNNLDVQLLVRDIVEDRRRVGKYDVTNLIYTMLSGLHQLWPKLEGQAQAQAQSRHSARRWDVFISYASQDSGFVHALADALRVYHLEVWIDRDELSIGDSIRQLIDHGLAQSRYGVVVLSPASLSKLWPRRELDALFEMEEVDRKVVLPLLHNVSHEELRKVSPLLAGRLGLATMGRAVTDVAYEIARVVARG
jgi:TIR domain-containing protein